MTKIEQMIFEDGFKEGLERSRKISLYRTIDNMYAYGLSAEYTAELTEENISLVKERYKKCDLEKQASNV